MPFSHTMGGQAVAFHPTLPTLAATFPGGIALYDIDVDALLAGPNDVTVHYANAKVVMVGESGVGKSALGLVLTGNEFRPTESTHGRHIWTLSSETARVDSGVTAHRETLLWDLAGQPGYRVFHRQHLDRGLRCSRALRRAERDGSIRRRVLLGARAGRCDSWVPDHEVPRRIAHRSGRDGGERAPARGDRRAARVCAMLRDQRQARRWCRAPRRAPRDEEAGRCDLERSHARGPRCARTMNGGVARVGLESSGSSGGSDQVVACRASVSS